MPHTAAAAVSPGDRRKGAKVPAKHARNVTETTLGRQGSRIARGRIPMPADLAGFQPRPRLITPEPAPPCRDTIGIADKAVRCEDDPFLSPKNSVGPWQFEVGNWLFDGAAGAGPRELRGADSPKDGPPLTDDQGTQVDAGDDILDRIELQLDFQLNIAAHTKDERNLANNQYTTRATADWSFNGDGTVVQTAPYDWTNGLTAKITAPKKWKPITDGSQPQRIDGLTSLEEQARIKFQAP